MFRSGSGNWRRSGRIDSLNVPLLSVRDLRVELPLTGGWRAAVDGVSFDLAAGESLAVVGESGCGKTLLGRALVNLAPEGARVTGELNLRGRDSSEGLPERDWRSVRGREIALVFQEPAAALDPVQRVGAQIVEAIRGPPGRVSWGGAGEGRGTVERGFFS